MKRVYLAALLAGLSGGMANAQKSEGGFPQSMSLKNSSISTQQIAKALFQEPDYAQLLREDEADARAGIAKPYRVAATVTADLGINNSGTWAYLEDGSKIWRLQIQVPGAKALSLYYDQFHFPEGVKLYISNANGRNILGAYTSNNNSTYHIFSSHEVQGEVSTLEINIPKEVSAKDITFHISKVYAYYRGVDDVNYYADDRVDQAKPTIDESSSCHVNANCPLGMDAAFLKSKAATVRMFDNGGLCSGTLINNTGNAAGGNCIPYVLTASHCDQDNSRDNAHFAGMEFRFNYSYAECAAGAQQAFQSRVGADFVARSNMPSIPNSGNAYVADFMLLKMKDAPPANSNAYLAGWNRNIGIWNNEDYDKYIGFHHPAGDLKKLSFGPSIFATGTFNQSAVANTHWDITFTTGGMAQGSSGSGLFEKDGLLIGDLSGGPLGNCDGKQFGTSALYSKISYAWENQFDQTAFPQYAGAVSRLKDWLDPNNTGQITLQATKADCSDMPVGINELETALSNAVMVYPNPSLGGKVWIKVNLADLKDVHVAVMDIKGTQVGSYTLGKVMSGTYAMDLSGLANGVYLLKFTTNDNVSVSKKILLSR
jgi:hypothetical protein